MATNKHEGWRLARLLMAGLVLTVGATGLRGQAPRALSPDELRLLQRMQPGLSGTASLELRSSFVATLRNAGVERATLGRARSYVVRPGELDVPVINFPVAGGAFAVAGGGELVHTGGLALSRLGMRVLLTSPIIELTGFESDQQLTPYAGRISFHVVVDNRPLGRIAVLVINRFANGWRGWDVFQSRPEAIAGTIDQGELVLSESGAEVLNRALGVANFRAGMEVAEAGLALVIQGEE